MTRQAELVDSADLSPSTPAGELPFGLPAAYWLDLRGYDPAAVAATLGKPILILQGGRDYQATVADDLAGWQAGLAGRPGVTIRVYEADNHLFIPGTGPSRQRSTAGQHVDPAVVADIADWLPLPPSRDLRRGGRGHAARRRGRGGRRATTTAFARRAASASSRVIGWPARSRRRQVDSLCLRPNP